MISENYQIILGDANGIDTLVQKSLLENNYRNVNIYCSGDSESDVRNNIGLWPVKAVKSLHPKGTRLFYADKDIKMARDADYGFMVWDSKSTGTLSNVIELIKQGKSSLVYIHKENIFIPVKKPDNIKELVSKMSPHDVDIANKKIHLYKQLENMSNKQMTMRF